MDVYVLSIFTDDVTNLVGAAPRPRRDRPSPHSAGRGPAYLARCYLMDFRAKSSVTGVPASSLVVRVWGL